MIRSAQIVLITALVTYYVLHGLRVPELERKNYRLRAQNARLAARCLLAKRGPTVENLMTRMREERA